VIADVAVVGAGPAGAAAAITLARAGRDVVLIDKARFPRDKCCGDGLTTGALRLLEHLGLEPAHVPSWKVVDDVCVRAPSGPERAFGLPRGAGCYAVTARRNDLDAALVDVARAAGVKVLDGHGLTGATEQHDRVRLDVDGLGELHVRYAVGADGMWSPLRKALGAGQAGYLGEWHAFRQYFTHVGPRASSELFVWFEPDLLPGYAWSFPLPDGRANVGFGVQRADLGRDGRLHSVQVMKTLWPQLLARPHIRDVLGPLATPESPHKSWPIPARIDAIQLTTRRALFVGDAAACDDPMTGEGIGQALITGVLAAGAIEAAGPDDAGAAVSRYREAVARDLVPDHKMSMFLIRAVRHRTGVRAALAVAGSTPWTRRNFARWLFEDYPRALVTTPRRWRKGALTGPGAYRH
jgi:geranylgeranyl reductase family protein